MDSFFWDESHMDYDGAESRPYVYEDDEDRFYPDDDDDDDVDEIQENEDFAHDNDYMEDQHLDGMYEE